LSRRLPLRTRLSRAWAALTGPAKREAFKGAELSRLTADWVTRPVAADQEVRTSLTRLRARGRELRRNSAVARQYLNLLGANVIGHRGMTLQAQVRNNDGRLAKPINDRLELAWRDWSQNVSLDGRLTLARFQQVCIKTVAADGEVLVRFHRRPDLPHALALEPLDPDLLDERLNVMPGKGQAEIRMGVEMDSTGRRVAYHVWNLPEGIYGAGVRVRERIPADQVLHLYDPDRVNQTRGVTWFASVMLPLRMLEGYVEAELVAARTGAAKMGWFVRKEGTTAGEVAPDENGNLTTEANPGTFDFAPDGYELQDWSPDHPSAAFPEFVKACLRQIAAGLGVSYNVLANDLEGVNYSSMRSGLLVERDVWRMLQEWWIASFLVPVFREWLAQSILSSNLVLDTRDPRKFQAVKFVPRGWPWVDPLKDIQAGELGIRNGLTSRTRLLAEQGADVEEIVEELKEEQAIADEAGVNIAGTPAPAAPGGPPTKKEDKPADDDEEPADDDTEEEPADAGRNGHAPGFRQLPALKRF
jgi:lambda family phage portal protein